MLRSCLFEYSYAYILPKDTLTIVNTAAQCQPNNGANKKVILKNCAPFTKCIYLFIYLFILFLLLTLYIAKILCIICT